MNGVYTIVVSNIGGTASSGDIRVTDDLRSTGFRFVSGTGTGWSCVFEGHPPNQDRTEKCLFVPGVIPAGGSAPPITLTVIPTVSGSVTNTVTVSGGGAADNTTSDVTIVIAAVPTLPEWATIVLTGLLAMAGVAALRRRTT
jgi:uncharacterized repeat protein (TIGR01451 family)